MVLDPFCGCATACVAADNLGREWLGIDISPKAVELVHMRLRDTLGELYHAGMVTARTDIPQRTDIEAPINYRQNRHVLFGEQEGKCNGCKMEFPFKMFEVDHVVPRSRGGTDHKSNLQLLCSSCNRIKGDRPMHGIPDGAACRVRTAGLSAPPEGRDRGQGEGYCCSFSAREIVSGGGSLSKILVASSPLSLFNRSLKPTPLFSTGAVAASKDFCISSHLARASWSFMFSSWCQTIFA